MFRLRRNLPRKLCFLERPAGREILCLHKDQEGRRSSPVGCCVVGNPIKGFPDAARHAAFVQLAIGKPVFLHAEEEMISSPPFLRFRLKMGMYRFRGGARNPFYRAQLVNRGAPDSLE